MKIKNLLFQPVTLHLAGSGEGLHLTAREVREMSARHISDEIRSAEERGLVALIGKVGMQSDAVSVVTVTPTDSDPQTTQKKGNRK
jgi:hypothetical protein